MHFNNTSIYFKNCIFQNYLDSSSAEYLQDIYSFYNRCVVKMHTFFRNNVSLSSL